MVSKELMLEFIQLNTFNKPPPQKHPVEVIDITLKDCDDEDGAIGEHYIVECRCSRLDSDKPQTCLVHKLTYNRHIDQLNSVKWI